MISESIIRICELPVDFKRFNKSTYTLLKETGFKQNSKDIQINEIKEYLKQNPRLINEWEIFSHDKRTNGGFYLILDNKNIVGSLDSGYKTVEKKFDTEIDACSEFIYLEVSYILNLKIK